MENQSEITGLSIIIESEEASSCCAVDPLLCPSWPQVIKVNDQSLSAKVCSARERIVNYLTCHPKAERKRLLVKIHYLYLDLQSQCYFIAF